MLYLILLLSSIWFGHEIVSFFIMKTVCPFYRFGIGIPLGIIICSYTFFVSTLYFPYTITHGSIITFLYILFSLILFLRRFNSIIKVLFIHLKKRISYSSSYKDIKSSILRLYWGQTCYNPSLKHIIIAVFLPSIFMYWWLNNSFLWNNKWTRTDVYGDLPIHLYVISSIGYGCNSQRKSLFDFVII